MTNTPASPVLPPAGRRATLSNMLAWLCLGLALLFPLGMLVNTALLLIVDGLAHPLLFVYNALDYIGVPVAVLAIVLGHFSQLAASGLPSAPARQSLARIGLLIGYLSLAFIVIVLIIMIAGSGMF